MAITTKTLYRGAATTSTSTTLYTVPGLTTTVISNIVVTNTSGSPATFTLTLANINIATTVVVGANDSILIDLKQVLETTETIKGGASTTSVNFHISGVEIS
jgi:hypothetical protein